MKNTLLRQKAEMILEAQESKDTASISSQQDQVLLHELQVHQIELEMQNEELQRKHDELQEAKNLYFDLYELAPIGYLTLDIKGKILKTNITFSKLCDVPKSTLLKQPLTSFIFFDDQDIFYKHHKELNSRQDNDSCELRMVRGDGTIFWAHLDSSVSLSSDGETLLLIAISDVSERKKMEELLKQSEKKLLITSRQSAMGEMISMIAHQWRQPLSVITTIAGSIKLIEQFKEHSDDTLIEKLDSIEQQAIYLSHTISDFRDFFRPDKPKERTSLSEIIYKALKLSEENFKKNSIEYDFIVQQDVELMTFRNEILQVLMTIFKNTSDAFFGSKIETRFVEVVLSQDNASAIISIKDNAGGIPKDVIDQIFLPYFTTKHSSVGTGLGLYMSKMVIEEHCKGILEVESENMTTLFRIKLALNT